MSLPDGFEGGLTRWSAISAGARARRRIAGIVSTKLTQICHSLGGGNSNSELLNRPLGGMTLVRRRRKPDPQSQPKQRLTLAYRMTASAPITNRLRR
jgi:hypothetical protein